MQRIDQPKTASCDLSIVVVNYNTRDLLLKCLDSIYDTPNEITLEVIVIDNLSSDGSVEAIQAQFPQVQVIANEENVYFSAGNNQGIARAVGRYVLALNPDTVVQGNTLVQLVAQMDANPEIGVATTTMFFPNGTLQRNGSRSVTPGYLLFNYTIIGKLWARRTQRFNEWLWMTDWDRVTQRDLGVLPGSCIIAAKSTWQAAGGFDARMPMYFSDDYFSRAVRQMGKRTVYLVSDGIVHYEGASSRQVSRRALRLYFHDLLVYTRLVFGQPIKVLLGVLSIPTWVVQWLKA
jgi:GT2 family glycosyltransferase